jgi:hypothetical protein
MSQEESIRDMLKSGRKNRRRNGLYKSHRRGHSRRAKMPKVSFPWHNEVLQSISDGTQVNKTQSQS